MKMFLNLYMVSNRHLKLQSAEELRRVFTNTIGLIVESFGEKALRPKTKWNSAVFDAVMVGIARRLETGELHNLKKLNERYQALLENEKFSTVVFGGGTTSEQNVRFRIGLATEAFADLK